MIAVPKISQLLFFTAGHAFSTTTSRGYRGGTIGRFLITASTGAHSVGAWFYWSSLLSCKNRFIIWWCWVPRHVTYLIYFLRSSFLRENIFQVFVLYKSTFDVECWNLFTSLFEELKNLVQYSFNSSFILVPFSPFCTSAIIIYLKPINTFIIIHNW